jgi:hypothetical protein
MNCEEFWNRMPELAKDDSAANGVTANDVAGHAAQCVRCATQLAQQRRLAGALRTLAAELASVETPARVEAGLISAFRATQAGVLSRRSVWWKTPALPWAAAAGFAAAALAFGIWMAPKRPVHAPASHRAAPSQVELASMTTDETNDGFIPLPNAPQIDPNDDVNVVRMELPRSAMLAVGLEVNLERVSDTVEAEVMLGSDGLARAVRFMDMD